MQKILLILFSFIFFITTSFSQDISGLKGPRPVIDLSSVPDDAYKQGIINIKFNRSVENILNQHPAVNSNGIITFGIPAVDRLNILYGVTQAFLSFQSVMISSSSDKQLLSIDENFTPKHKAWGLHLWYKLKFPSTVDIKEIVAKYQQLTGIVDVAEPNYKAALINDKINNNSSTTIPNDPMFSQQWNYNNTGQAGGIPGRDIHLPQAWDIETGDSSVIVAVDDGGIQLDHPDLAANIWYGKGFNFVNNTNIIDPNEHATHTAGTIGAVNNNGIGVSGIAGGDGTNGSGIRLMSMEVFGPDSADASNFGAPLVWSADRGAAISQNSWGYKTSGVFDQEVLDGIDYFVANGGGNVLTGGLVVFSAGNDNSESPKYPAYYPKVIAVAATNNKDIRSYYSNYGSWVDISAPGGEQLFGNDSAGILSTTWHSSYEFLQGTSMACPHVSGVAALIVSKTKGLLTADSVRSILLANADDIYPINSPTYAKKLGTGRLNAFKCMQASAQIANIGNRDAKISQFIFPAKGINLCTTDFSPIVRLVNVGKDTLKTVQIGIILDGIIQPSYSWSGSLKTFAGTNVTLDPVNTATTGPHSLIVFTYNPNQNADEQPANDTAIIYFNIQQPIALPASQDFEPVAAPMPPPGGWSIFNYDNDTTWEKRFDILGPKGDTTSVMWMNSSNYNSTGAVDIFSTPKIDLTGIDTIHFSFDLSYQQWANTFVDTLEVVYSPDCGATWLPTGYKKWGASLSTAGNAFLQGAYFPADSGQWRNEKVDIATCTIAASDILIGLKWINGFGNNCFIDNITISKVNSVQRNAALISIDEPNTVICSTSLTPKVTIANYGTETLTSLNINYQLDNGPVNIYNWTGSLSKCAEISVQLNNVLTTFGNHIIKVFTDDPNSQPDQFTPNDTLTKQLDISPAVNTPVVEGFETDTFPPANWSLLNPDASITWQRSTVTGRSGNASMMINNFNYAAENTEDIFFSPVIANSTAIDSMFVSFDMSYATGLSSSGAADTLEILVSTDCGATYKTVWKKWGEDLQTLNDPHPAVTGSFIPLSSQWKHINIYLTPYIGSSGFQVFFVAKSNHQNNLWIDNINIYSKSLPQKLKQQGYLIYPDPFSNTLSIYHSQPPIDLKEIQVFNSVGQLVLDNHYTGNANTETDINMKSNASGVYYIKLTYTDKSAIIQKVAKN